MNVFTEGYMHEFLVQEGVPIQSCTRIMDTWRRVHAPRFAPLRVDGGYFVRRPALKVLLGESLAMAKVATEMQDFATAGTGI